MLLSDYFRLQLFISHGRGRRGSLQQLVSISTRQRPVDVPRGMGPQDVVHRQLSRLLFADYRIGKVARTPVDYVILGPPLCLFSASTL